MKIIAIQEITGMLLIAAQEVNDMSLSQYKNMQYLISILCQQNK